MEAERGAVGSVGGTPVAAAVGSAVGGVSAPLPRIEGIDSPDDQVAWIDSPDAYPDGEFLAVAVSPCPLGRFARGGVGGQMFTSCSACGHVSASTAMVRHDDPVFTLVVAYTSEVAGRSMVAFRRATLADLDDES